MGIFLPHCTVEKGANWDSLWLAYGDLGAGGGICASLFDDGHSRSSLCTSNTSPVAIDYVLFLFLFLQILSFLRVG